jgi:hypothetical protein
LVTTYFLDVIAGNVFRTKTTPPLPGELFLGMSSTRPNLNGTGVTEPSSGVGYSRVKLTTLSAPVNGVVSNTGAVTFAESTGNWSTMRCFVVYDSLTGGNLLMYDEMLEPRSVEASTIVLVRENSAKFHIQNPA